MTAPILSVKNLTIKAEADNGLKTLVDHISFNLEHGEILGLVGESGSGKSMTCRAIIQLFPSAKISISGGSVILRGKTDLSQLTADELCRLRGSDVGMIFQNPSSHLDPVMTVGGQIIESIRTHQAISRADARNKAIEILQQVGIPDPDKRINNYPHEFSGGMRQRVMIAIALACDPDILIADEPTTALDVTVQAQILRLLLELQQKRGLSIILITHDLGVVAQICDRVAVMYAGSICELGPKRDIILDAGHPYTSGLIACQPSSKSIHGKMQVIPGQPPGLDGMPSGCAFHPRCSFTTDICKKTQPSIIEYQTGHSLACHNPRSNNRSGDAL